ncbi:MAG: putative bifunctional diguanylate cyclase/phosphodiesterase [Geminicoccaceae bacterium]
MTISRRARLVGAGLLGLALLLFGGSLIAIERRLQVLSSSVDSGGTEASWNAFQARFELERLLHELDRALDAEPDPTALRTRLDLFWSRVDALRSGSDATAFRALPGAGELLGRLDELLRRYQGAVASPIVPADLAALRTELAQETPLLQQLMLGVLQSSAVAHSRLQHNLRELRPAGWASLLGLSGSATIVMVLLYREGRSTRQLLARTEESRARIEHLAHHDALTGLPNRRLFEDRLIQALAVAARARRRVALLYLDLDGFKEINDSLGHRAGDELLRTVAERLAGSIRGGDTIARLGGDEFAVIQIELRAAPDAAVLAERLMAAAARPVRIAQQEVVVGSSVGIAIFPEDGGTADEMCANADVALYSAKAAGRARMAYYRPELTTEARTRGLLRRDLARGIDGGELELHYQPKIAASDGSVTGLEALLRWRHPQRGVLGPGAFLPMAEETGLIEPLGSWVLQDAVAQIGRWRAGGISPPRVAINLSASQLRRGGVARRMAELIESVDIPPGLIELELTEHVLLDDDPRVHRELDDLRRLGVAIALDDFGTGYSSLSYLHRLHLRTVKIDRSLVGQFGDRRAETICEHVVRLAHDLGLVVVAEGVETWRHVEIARAIGFDELQGYWFAKPAPVEEITGRLRAQPAIPDGVLAGEEKI